MLEIALLVVAVLVVVSACALTKAWWKSPSRRVHATVARWRCALRGTRR
jgi:hypothetical protein